MVELLVVISIIGILSAFSMGALQLARESAREAKTKATITKLNNIIMRKYESYMTRRVPISTTGLNPYQSAQDRLYAIRDIMRMELPDRDYDVNDAPIALPNSSQSVARPAISQLFYDKLTNHPPGPGNGIQNGAAELLYMIVSMGSPEAMEQFSQSEIGDTNENGYPEFIDGWGRPIFFLRWAPAFSSGLSSPMPSNLQTGNATTDHDPFDTRRVDTDACQLFPLIYSAGSDGKLGIANQENYHFGDTGDPGAMFVNSVFLRIGEASDADGSYSDYNDNITNHNMEQR